MSVKSCLLGAVTAILTLSSSAFAWALSSYPDNTVIASDDKSRWFIAGGARFYIHPEQWANYAAPTVNLSASAIANISPIPRDGTMLQQATRPEVFKTVGGMYFHVPDSTELQYFNTPPVRVVPFNNQHFPAYGSNGEGKLVRERSGTQTYLVYANAKFPVSASELPYFNTTTNPVQTVPNTSLAKISDTPDCGVLLRERGTTDVYVYTGNGKYLVTGAERTTLESLQTVKDVPQGSLGTIPTVSSGGSGSACMKGNGGRYVTLTVATTSKCLQTANKSLENGPNIVQMPCDGSTGQQFQLMPYPDGSYMIRGRDSGKCFDIFTGKTDDANPIVSWACHSGMNQRVEIKPTADGWNLLVFKKSGKCLDLYSANTVDGANFVLYTCNSTSAQKFKFN